MAVETNRWGIIYNPKAGSRNTQKKWDKIREYMEERGVMFDYMQSEGYGSVERLARMLANNGYRTIVVVGGDGAINDIVECDTILSLSAQQFQIANGKAVHPYVFVFFDAAQVLDMSCLQVLCSV